MKKVKRTTEKINSKKHLPILQEKLKRKHYRKALEIIEKLKLRGYTVTRSRLKEEYKLLPAEIEKLNYIEVDNPHYKKSGAMRLYLINEIEDKFMKKD
jgi:hypothetical protein